jgi:hypothetical protein
VGRQIPLFATDSDFHMLLDLVYKRGLYVIDFSGKKLSLNEIKDSISEVYKTGKHHPHFFIVRDGWKIAFSDGFVNQLDSEAIELSICHRIHEKKIDLSPVDKHFQKGGFTTISSPEESDKYHKMLDEYLKDPILIPNPNYVENGYEHGRIWYPTCFFGANGKTTLPTRELGKEYNALVRSIKKISIRSDDKLPFYMLPDATENFRRKNFVPRSGSITISFSEGE